jgi:ribosomal protein L17
VRDYRKGARGDHRPLTVSKEIRQFADKIKLHAKVTDRIISARDKQVNLNTKNILKKLVFLLGSNSGGRHGSGRNKMTARRNKKKGEEKELKEGRV